MAAIIDYRGKSPEKTTSGVPLVTAKIIKGGRIERPEEFIAEADFDDWMRRGMPKPGDIVMTTEAPLGEVAQLDGRKVALAQRVIAMRGKPDVLDNLFLKFLLQSNPVQEELRSRSTGTTVVGIRQSELRKVSLTLPPLAEQKAIAAVLGALDDKIELNRRMNATLEAMARALFQSWFVDFDPVRAKLDGRTPAALDPATAALFPDSFQESPLGHIPKGWETSTMGAKLQTVLGGTPSRAKPEYWTDGTVAWINSGKTNEFRIIEPSELITKEALEKSATKLLPRRTTVLAITGATLGQVSITEIDCCANQSVVAILASEEFPTEFVYPWIEENIDKLIASQTGGAQQHVNKRNVDEFALLCPDHRVVTAYQTKAKPLFDQIAANCFQSHTLANLRDTLLPKLMSGAITMQTAHEELPL
jgi:type I restriction enzyme S subunit